jgi:NAD dependent epimerase/dehydratase family enzyme
MFIYLLDKNLHNTYNGCAPEIKTNKEMSETIASILHRPFIPFPAPGFILKTVMGEMANMLLMSNNCSSHKIMDAGFVFRYPTLKEALEDIYKN